MDVNELWRAKTVVDATLHPDTGEKIFLPFRMSSFVPTNLAVTAALLIPNPSTATLLLAQWANQSVNVAINWANANKTTPMSVNETFAAYSAAVVSSMSVSYGLKRAIKSPGLARFVPFAAVAVANTVNVFMVRSKELRDGIQVFDGENRILGKSCVAAKYALTQVSISRIVTAFPVLVFPPLIMGRLTRTAFFRDSQLRQSLANFGLILVGLTTALPCAIALFPQRGSIAAKDLEPEFHVQPGPLFFNKGL